MGRDAEAERRSCVAAFGFTLGFNTSGVTTGSPDDVDANRKKSIAARDLNEEGAARHDAWKKLARSLREVRAVKFIARAGMLSEVVRQNKATLTVSSAKLRASF